MPVDTWLNEQVEALVAVYDPGNFAQVVEQGFALLAQYSQLVIVYTIVGAANAELGRYDAAIENHTRAIALEPEYTEAYCNLADAQFETGDFAAAIHSFQRAIQLKPDYVEAQCNLGNALREQGDLNAAIESYRQAIALQPNLALAHYNLGITHNVKGDPDSAIQSYRRAIELHPNFAEAFCNLGNALGISGDRQAAISAYQEAIKLRPNYGEAHYNLGLTYKDLKRYEDALQSLATANTDKAFAESLFCLHALGRHEEFLATVEANLASCGTDRRVAAICAFFAYQTGLETLHAFCPDPLETIGFGSLIGHVDDQDGFIDRLEHELLQRAEWWEPDGKTTQKGFQTLGNLFTEKTEYVMQLKGIIEDEIDAYRDAFAPRSDLFFEHWPENTRLTGWSVRLQSGGYQNPHIHPSGWLSGVVYLKPVDTGKDGEGSIEFRLAGADFPMLKDEAPTRRHQPEKGDIVLFPSSLPPHHPFPNEGERVIVAFDLLAPHHD